MRAHNPIQPKTTWDMDGKEYLEATEDARHRALVVLTEQPHWAGDLPLIMRSPGDVSLHAWAIHSVLSNEKVLTEGCGAWTINDLMFPNPTFNVDEIMERGEVFYDEEQGVSLKFSDPEGIVAVLTAARLLDPDSVHREATFRYASAAELEDQR